jgi:hypothetical protein
MGQVFGRDSHVVDLYGGVSGAQLPCDYFELEDGVYLKKIYAHFMNPALIAFARPEKGKPHPAPWKSISGGRYFDIEFEIFISTTFKKTNWFDRINTIWWIAALLRLRCASSIRVPVVTDTSFADIVNNKIDPVIWPRDTEPSRISLGVGSANLSLGDLEWIKRYWISAGSIMNSNDNFNSAFRAFDNSTWNQNPAMGLILLWGGLERLFCGNQQELSFRASASIASYLETRGRDRYELYKKIKKLYVERSKAAHGNLNWELSVFRETHLILKQSIEKIISENVVPTKETLEKNIFL